jgi:hypothetical protein
VKQIESADKDFFNVALAAAREMPGAEVTEALVAAVEKLPPERQALLLLALGDRKDAAPASVFIAAAKSPAVAVREAAVHVFSNRGGAEAVAVLLDAAMNDKEVSAIAKEGLVHLPGKDADPAILARWPKADAWAKIVLLNLIGDRQILDGKTIVLGSMDDADQPIRLAAVAAMAQLVDVEGLNVLIDRATPPEGDAVEITAAKTALEKAAKRMGDRDACAEKIAARLGVKPLLDKDQSFLFDLLCKVSGKKALAAVVAGAKSSDPAVKDAATRVLGEWLNTDAAPALLDIAKNDTEKKYQIRALHGYIRIARQLEIPWWEASNAGEMKLTMFDAAMKAAKRADEKKLALDILTRIPSSTTLRRATACLDDPQLKATAADVAVKIAEQVAGGDPKAVAEAMTKVLEAGVKGNVEQSAKQLLKRTKNAK